MNQAISVLTKIEHIAAEKIQVAEVKNPVEVQENRFHQSTKPLENQKNEIEGEKSTLDDEKLTFDDAENCFDNLKIQVEDEKNPLENETYAFEPEIYFSDDLQLFNTFI